jgi:hypothetical protein
MKRYFLASLAVGVVAGTMGTAIAQTPPSRVRATIDSVSARR